MRSTYRAPSRAARVHELGYLKDTARTCTNARLAYLLSAAESRHDRLAIRIFGAESRRRARANTGLV